MNKKEEWKPNSVHSSPQMQVIPLFIPMPSAILRSQQLIREFGTTGLQKPKLRIGLG